jgi:hypothetical protein
MDEDGVTTFGRVAAGLAGFGMIIMFALGWKPPSWLAAGIAGILFYCVILIAIGQFCQLVWEWGRSKWR